MAYQIKPKRSLVKERRRIALEQLDKALQELDSDALDVREYVHQLRVRIKKLRALLRLFRPSNEKWFDTENAWLRDFAAQFAGPRDADVAVETFHKIVESVDGGHSAAEFNEVLGLLEQNRTRRFQEEAPDSPIPQIRTLLKEGRSRIENWPEKKMQTKVLVSGFCRTYSRGRKALQQCARDTQPEHWHEWRKRVKYQRYQWKLLQRLWPNMIKPRRHELHRLSDLLGEIHDLSEFVNILDQLSIQNSQSRDKLVTLANQRSDRARRAALPLGEKLFSAKEKCVGVQIRQLYRIANEKYSA